MSTIAPLAKNGFWGPETLAPGRECPHHHLQFYTADSDALVANVSDYLSEGLDRGEGILVIATPEHRLAFERRMAARGSISSPNGVERAKDTGQLLFVDAQDLLSRLAVDGQFDAARFDHILGETMDQVRPPKEGLPLRAYGEMVGLLWSAGDYAAAARLEDFWNTLLLARRFQLYCAYPIDVFGAEFHTPAVAPVLQSHTHLISSGNDGAVQAAISRAAGGIFEAWDQTRHNGSFRAHVPEGEAKILWLRENRPDVADDILSQARQHYRTEKRFRALVENSSDAIALVDPRGRILYASPSTARVLGYPPEKITGRNSTDFIHPEDRESVCRTMNGVLNRPHTPLAVQLRVCRADGRWCWIEATGSNLLDEPDISAIIFSCRDISDRRAAETALRESEAALRDANTGLEQFAYAAAHDLQEPIRNVRIYLELLARKYRDQLDAEANEFIGIAVDGALRMQTLTRDLLAFTRSLDNPVSAPNGHGAISGTAADANKVMAEVVANLQSAVEESQAEITWDDLPALPIHHAHLLQVLQNLIGNALKYRGARPPRVHISVRREKDEWLVSVADNGIGVRPEYQEQIFGIFKRLHGRDVPGNGIGLAICSRIVTHYKGRIWVAERPGGGSIFSFTLPREKTNEPGLCGE